MAPETEPPIFISRSKTLEITDFSILKSIHNKNGIELERFTVGGYDWAIEFYPQGINESISDCVSVFVKLLNATKPEQSMYSFCLWDWSTSKWSSPFCLWDWSTSKWSSSTINFVPISPSDGKTRWGYENCVNNSLSDDNRYLKDDMFRLRYILLVTPRLPALAPALKPDVDKLDDNGNHGNPSGADISFHNGFHTDSYAPPNAPSNQYTKLPRQPTVRIYCEAAQNLSITARNGTVVLAPADSNDHYQHWIKDMNSFNEAKDPDGFPIFALVNRVTGEALKNPAGENQKVSLVPYDQNCLDNSVKWTEVASTGFRAIRITSTPTLNMTAIDKYAGIFNDGTKIVVQRWNDTPIQHWKIVPYNSNVPY
ncbi:BTB/POZ and MATH domain-containing protein 4 [Carex littledalei]|uniref:BTB/POZ and MATH domain-containing protein 4 n=1 Tax=Carex littledalei TaxID=544730 RepID=A0A833QUQ1_9POAL|nr:BTB/POZ and MATH domain-containing protein 4 [Carex littledalei]